MKQGYQCGMLWGSALAVGAESFRRHKDQSKAIVFAVNAAQRVLDSFVKRTKSTDCLEIAECDFTNKLSMVKHMITGRFLSCFRLAEDWAPEAVQSAIEGLSGDINDLQGQVLSCASETVTKMGESKEDIITVAGLAGGIGLSGGACGALGAAIWVNTMSWCRKNKKMVLNNPAAERVSEAFLNETDKEYLCENIAGRKFETITQHSEFIKNGGCSDLINKLSNS